MTDYTINLVVNDKEAEQKLDTVDKKVKDITKPKPIELKLPSFDKVKKDLQEVGKYAAIATVAFKQFTPVGQQLSGFEETVKQLGAGLAVTSRVLATYSSPIRGMSDGFSLVAGTIDRVITSTAQLGFAIFGVTQSVNVLKAAFGDFFNETVGREVRLREQILQTATTLAGTNRVFADGFEIDDPVQKLKLLEGAVVSSIDRLRTRSLEIAGTTSEAVIGVFNIISSQIGSFGGTLKQAEDLAVKFSGALGTLGMSDPMYARQEIGSIMMGYVDSNSVLAKTIGITNADIQRAKQTGDLVEYLGKKLEVFEAGQKTAAKGFSGITSNLKELQDELKRSFGASLLDPIIKRLDAFYSKLSGKEVLTDILQTSRAFGQLVGGTLNRAVGIASGASIFKGVDPKFLSKISIDIQAVFAKVAIYIQDQLARVGSSIQRIVDNILPSITILAKAFLEVGAALARLKIDQLAIQLRSFSALSNVILAAAKAYAVYLDTVEKVLSLPVARYINEVATTFKLLDRSGALGFAQFLIGLNAIRVVIPVIIEKVKLIATVIGTSFQSVFARIGSIIPAIVARVTAAITAITTNISLSLAKLTLMIAELAGRIEITLNVIATKLSLGGRALNGLSGPIIAVSKAFGTIATAAETAEAKITELGVAGRAAMVKLQASADKAGASVAILGTNLKGNLANGAKTAASGVGSLVFGLGRGLISMAGWTIAISVLIDALGRLSAWWDDFQQDQRFKQTIDELNNGLLDQAKAARAAGKALDAVTEAKTRMAEQELSTKLQKEIDLLLKYEKELKKRAYNLGLLRGVGAYSAGRPDPNANLSNEQLALKRDPALDKMIKDKKKEIAQIEAKLKELRGTDTERQPDPELKAQENRQRIEDLANFEKQARQSIEEELYSYRRQIQDKELDLWKQQGELRIDQIDQANRRLIEGVDAEARASLEALNNWITSKRRGELDLEARRKQAQLAAADLERALGRFRLNLEQQVAEIRKRIGEYEIQVLDRRLQAEQMIADIRNGSIEWNPESATSGAGAAGMGDASNPDVIARATKATEKLTNINNKCAEAVRIFMQTIGISTAAMDQSAVSAQRMGRVMTDWSKLQPGDIVARGRVGNPSHVGVYTGGSNVFHQSATRGLKAGNFPDLGYFKQNGFFIRPYAAPQFTGNALPPEVRALLDTIAYAEGTANQKNGGYGTLFGYGQFNFNGPHPDKVVKSGRYSSTAAGRYQFLTPTWREWAPKAGVNVASMAPGNQDKVAWALANLRRGVSLNELRQKGLTADIAAKLAPEWASFPTLSGVSAYGQPVKQLADLQRYYNNRLTVQRSGGASAPSGGVSAGSLAAVDKPTVNLKIDSSELDTAVSKLKALAQDDIRIAEEAAQLRDNEGFAVFQKSLDSTSADLEKIKVKIRDARVSLVAVNEASKGGIFDPQILEANIRYQQALKTLDEVRVKRLAAVSKLNGIKPDEIKKANAAIETQYKKDKENLAQIFKDETEVIALTKMRDKILKINDDIRQAGLQGAQELFRLESEARGALFNPEDFAANRREAALREINDKFLEYTNNNTETMTNELRAKFTEYAKVINKNAESATKLDIVIDTNRKLRELENQKLQARIQRYSDEMSGRFDAARSVLDPTDFRSNRRLDVQREVFNKYLEYTKGGTVALPEELRKSLEDFRSKLLTNADALAKVDHKLRAFAERLAISRESAQTMAEGYKNALSNIFKGGSIKDTFRELNENIASFFTEKLLSYAMKPLETQFKAMFDKFFGVNDAQLENTNAINANTDVITKLTAAIQATPTPVTSASTTTNPAPENGATSAQITTNQAAEGIDKLTTSTDKLAKGVTKNATETEKGTNQTLTNMQKFTSGLASVATSALSIAGGIGMMKEGGTYNTLMGLAGIFGGLSSVTGMFGTGGIFSGLFGRRALGGPVLSRQPYLVGESGPELFLPDSSGEIVSNSGTRDLFQRTREALQSAPGPSPEGGTRSQTFESKPIDVRYESQVINNVEYVTAEQHRKGMQEAARRGQMMAYQGLQYSVKVRRRLGV